MPRNLKGGNKSKKGSNKKMNAAQRMPFITKEPEGQVYARIIKSQGGSPPKLTLVCSDSKERLGILTGKMKRTWCNKDDIVLVNLRDYQDARCDIIWKYDDKDVRRLIKEGEISVVFGGISNSNISEYDMNIVNEAFDFEYKPEEGEEGEGTDPKKKKESSSESSSESETESESESESESEFDIAKI
jgi:translation initiation factor 1A